jgi:PAS domain S-box-containing protein
MSPVENHHLKASHSSNEILVAAPDCINVLSPDGVIRFINSFGLALLGATSREEVVGKSYVDFWPAAMHQEIREALADAMVGRHTQIEGICSTMTGTWRWWEAHFHVVDGDQHQREIICIARDLTDRHACEVELQAANERLTAQLAEAERRKVAFIATLAHELRNPLAPVRSGLEVLRDAGDDRSAVETALHIMERQVAQMVRLINDLLDVARVSSDKMELQRSHVDLQTVVREAAEATAPLMTKRKQTLSVTMPEEALCLYADAARLVQVFSNLLNNASKYTAAGGRIAINAERSDTTVRVSVIDSGIGLAEPDLERVFEMFTLVGQDASGVQEGLGIGLSLVRQLVEMHAGTVTAHSEGPGKGSQFVVTLPIVQSAAAAAATNPGKRHVAEIRILLVDDNVDAAKMLALLLDYDDHVIRVAESGREALRIVGEFRPDIVFLDIGMPGMDGYAVARAVRAMTDVSKPVLVALTGWGGPLDRERTKEAGFDGHLTKPADLTSIEAMLFKVKDGQGTLAPDPNR